MNDRLSKLCLLPPPVGMAWTAPPPDSMSSQVARNDGIAVRVDVPLFWYDPEWCHFDTDIADAMAVAVGRLRICVSALRSDLAAPDDEPDFHSPDIRSDAEEDADANTGELLPRMVPYRPERYGLSELDFDGARIVDLRLAIARDETGRFAYSPRQIQRWEATPDEEPLAGGSWVPAATFPPDVPSIKYLKPKLNQLRALSPEAAVFISVGPYRIEQEIPAIVATKPDGLIIRMDDPELGGFQIAQVTRRARQLVEAAGAGELPLWVVPGDITAADAVKLIALGASAVAVDSWCNTAIAELQQQTRESTRYSSRRRIDEAYVESLVDEYVGDPLGRVSGLLASTLYSTPNQRLGSFDPQWAQALAIPTLLGGQDK